MNEPNGYGDWPPEQAGDDTDVGWGELPRGLVRDDEDVQRYLDDRPPHHGE